MKHMRATLSVAVFAMLVVAAPARAEPVVVELAPQAALSSSTVVVGDVARVRGGTAALRDRVSRLDLIVLTARDPAQSIRRRQIEFRLRLSGIAREEFEVAGAEECNVTVFRKPIAPEQIVAAARDAVLRRLPQPTGDVAIELVQPVAARLPELIDGETLTLQAEPHGTVPNCGRLQMDVTVTINGEKRLALPVFLEIKKFEAVAICKRSLAAGDTFSDANVRLERRPAELGRRTASAESVAGKKAVRLLQPGQVVLETDVEQTAAPETQVLIRARQRVHLVVRLGAVNVVAAGEAMQDGKLGQSIRVQNLDSKKVISGRVSAPGTVEVDMGVMP